MIIEHRDIVVDDTTTVASEWAVPSAYDRRTAMAIAHGAGNGMDNPLLSYLHRAMADAGVLAVKFNFPYMQLGRRAPDPAARLMRTWRAVVAQLAADTELSPERLVLSGKSLGGRMASMVAAAGTPAGGLVFFGYPLHPPKRFDKLRTDHLVDIRCPMLFIQGTRDTLCDLDLLRSHVIDKYPDRSTLHVIDGGDHSFNLPKRLGRTEQSVRREIVETTVQWLSRGA